MTADLPADVRIKAAEALELARRTYDNATLSPNESARALAMSSAVVAVVAPEIERPLQARITELEARQTMLWRCSSCGTHNTELMADALRGQLDAENRELAVLTRVELLTAALTDAIEALGWASDYVAVPWPKVYQVEPLRAALAAGVTESGDK